MGREDPGMALEAAVIEWKEDRSLGPRLLARTADAEIVESVCDRLAAQRRRELALIARPVRLVREGDPKRESEG